MNFFWTIVLDGLIQASWLFIVALGLTLVFGVLKILNIAHGSLYALGAYVAATAVTMAAHGLSARLGLKDPGLIVVDEIAGQMLTFLGLPLSGPVLAAGFVLFRAFDVLKPPPARQYVRHQGI